MDNVIVVASGKGGTGKSTVCICLSVALVKQGKRVLLIDCDCGMRGLDIMLDMEQDIIFDASDAVCGNCTFGEAVYKSKNNVNIAALKENLERIYRGQKPYVMTVMKSLIKSTHLTDNLY